MEPDVLRVQCPPIPAGHEFSLTAPDRAVGGRTEGALPVIFGELRVGSVTITGVQPNTSTAPYVFCSVTGPDGQTLRAYDYQFLSGPDSITYQLDTFETLRCDWFFVPGDVALAVEVPIELCAGTTPTPEASRNGLGITIGRESVCRREDAPND